MSTVVSTKVARYPWLEEATEEVESRVDGFSDLVSEAVLDRAGERVVLAVERSEVGDIASSPRVELYSYPVARAVVSVVDDHAVTRRYAWSEAVTAFDRLKDDVNSSTSFGSVGEARLGFDDVVQEFGFQVEEMSGSKDGGGGGQLYEMPLESYLEYAAGMNGEEWKLVNREVDSGRVEVSRVDVLEMAREAILRRVSDGLPLDVSEDVEDLVESAVDELRDAVAHADLSSEIDRVEETEFPPCMKALLSDVRNGEHLDHHSRFAVTAFLTNIGMSTDEIVETYEVNPGFGEEMTRYQTDHIQGKTSPTEYSCPSCSTMVTYGDCRNRDELCDTINHPLAYYRRKLEELDDEELDDEEDEEGGEHEEHEEDEGEEGEEDYGGPEAADGEGESEDGGDVDGDGGDAASESDGDLE